MTTKELNSKILQAYKLVKKPPHKLPSKLCWDLRASNIEPKDIALAASKNTNPRLLMLPLTDALDRQVWVKQEALKHASVMGKMELFSYPVLLQLLNSN